MAAPVLVLAISGAADASLTFKFKSYHAFCIYGSDRVTDPNTGKPVPGGLEGVFKKDANEMAKRFRDAGFDATVYGPDEDAGDLSQAIEDMQGICPDQKDELLVFYYSGHGDHYWPAAKSGGINDDNKDESDDEDPLPPGIPSDNWDEQLAYDVLDGVLVNGLADDDFGAAMKSIQEKCCWVSGILECCGANGMLDGTSDMQGYDGKESIWMTADVEWDPCAGELGNTGHGPLTYSLLKSARGPGDTLGDLWDWYWSVFGSSHRPRDDTWGIKLYEELDSTKWYVPEPASLVLWLVMAIAGGACLRRKQRAPRAGA